MGSSFTGRVGRRSRFTGRRALTSARRVGKFWAPLLIVLVLWETVARLGFFEPVLFPSVSGVVSTVAVLSGWGFAERPAYDVELFNLLSHSWRSMLRFVAGFGFAVLAGTGLGLLMGRSRRLHRLMYPLISIVMPVPALAWVPIFMVWFGTGETATLCVVFVGGFFAVLYNTRAGVVSVSQLHIWATETMGARPHVVFLKVLIPGALPYIMTGLKIGMGQAWRAMVGAEMLAATQWGLGFMIFEAREFLLTEVSFAGIGMIALIMLAIEHGVFAELEKRTIVRWGMVGETR